MAKIKVLFLAASPNVAPLQLEEEIREITAKIRAADYRDSLEIISRWAVRPDDLQQALLEHKPHILHFSGHGSQSEELILLDDDRAPKPVSKKALVALLTTLKDNLRVVVLNACYSKPQAVAISQVVDCVLGMNREFGDEAAIKFAAAFYRAVGFGRSVQTAFELGTSALMLEQIPEANTPQIVAREGLDPAGLVLIDGPTTNANVVAPIPPPSVPATPPTRDPGKRQLKPTWLWGCVLTVLLIAAVYVAQLWWPWSWIKSWGADKSGRETEESKSSEAPYVDIPAISQPLDPSQLGVHLAAASAIVLAPDAINVGVVQAGELNSLLADLHILVSTVGHSNARLATLALNNLGDARTLGLVPPPSTLDLGKSGQTTPEMASQLASEGSIDVVVFLGVNKEEIVATNLAWSVCTAGKDLLILLEDATEARDLAQQWKTEDMVEVINTRGRIVWISTADGQNIADFFSCVRSREKGHGDIRTLAEN